MRIALLILFVYCTLQYVMADIYMHSPRGSNNRGNEKGRERNNANRLFDSQNNNRGGYNVGSDESMYYIEGSELQVQWTNQHSCGNENTDCDVIIQYACGELMRDGRTTKKISRSRNENKNTKYSMNEDFYSYKHCRLRQRNKGLFTANQKMSEGATSTRQNRKGTRHGYECNEERDYYPYWFPTMWKDVAVFTNDPSRCKYYQTESENVKGRSYCQVSDEFLEKNRNSPPGNKFIPITKEECEQFTYRDGRRTRNGVWRDAPAHNIAAPECLKSHYSRDNHLGNTVGGQTPHYNWKIPNDVNENCAMRIRYNITSGEYNRDTTTSQHNNRKEGNGPDVWSRFGFDEGAGVSRGYKLVDNPKVDVFDSKFKLRVALNTAQFGRTFQDRSHIFGIKKRPTNIPANAAIKNMNVRGKRGNIVQVFPAVEYDFTPNTLSAAVSNYVHVQWTGSNNNPGNNDGQGKRGTDRSNVALLIGPKYDEGQITKGVYGHLGNSYPALLKGVKLGGLNNDALKQLSVLSPQRAGDELNGAKTYFDLGPKKLTQAGTFNYMCTRNNNFSNRNQKGKLQVTK